MPRIRVARFALCLLLAACVRGEDSPYTRAVAAGERAQTAGRFNEAKNEYERAIRLASTTSDRDHAEELAIRMQMKAGDARGAAERLRAVADAKKKTSAHALYDLALLEGEKGDPEASLAIYREVLERFPDTSFGRRSLHWLVGHEEERGQQAALTYLEALQSKLASTTLAETVAYQIATKKELLGRKNEARYDYLEVAKKWPYPHGDLYDNALVHASRIAEETGDYASAVADLERLLSTREVASLMGTYQRPEYSRALFHLAEIFRDRLHDKERARAAFHRLYSDFKTSSRRDDALWEEAKLADDPCGPLSTLVSAFPDSRYIACATARCKEIRRPEKSRARPDCHYSLESRAGESNKDTVEADRSDVSK